MNWILDNLDWLGGTLELLGMYLVGNKRKFGFVLSCFCCITWAIVAIHRDLPGLLLVVVPAFVIGVRNWLRWRHQESPPG